MLDKLPEPPGDLDRRLLPLVELVGPLFRDHKRRHQPLYFNRTDGRFAPPDRQSFGVLYVGTSPYCSFIEMFDFSGQIEFGIREDSLRLSCLCPVTPRRALRVVDLTTGPGLKRLSPRADSRIGDGAYDLSRRWAAAIWSHPAKVDGLLYRARNAPELFSVALFDRVEAELMADCAGNLFADPQTLGKLLDYFSCPLMP